MAGRVSGAPTDERSSYLPDLCAARAALAIVLMSVLLGLVFTLSRQSVHGDFWADLARTSTYLLWNGLLCAAVLCKSRPWLARRNVRDATLLALGLMVATVAVVAEVVYWFGVLWAGRFGVASGLFPREHWPFVLPSLLISAILGALALRYFYVASEWRRNVELEARSRVMALQARIRPHFLFNSMNTIASLTRTDPSRAEEAIEDLSDLFRANLSEARGWITLREELEVARIYQRIEQLRLGERLRVEWKVGELPARALVPSLLLQPLLENAIGHGIEPLPEGGVVRVTGRLGDDGSVIVEFANPIQPGARRLRGGHGIALDNIRQRLELAFPGRSSVEVEDGADSYRVRLTFPLISEPGAHAAA